MDAPKVLASITEDIAILIPILERIAKNSERCLDDSAPSCICGKDNVSEYRDGIISRLHRSTVHFMAHCDAVCELMKPENQPKDKP